MKEYKEIELKFEKIVPEGRALGRYNGKVVFAYGVLPGEVAKVRITKQRKNIIFGEVTQLISTSRDRVEAGESHYLICSPWQTMRYEQQLVHKQEMIKESFRQFANYDLVIDSITASPKLYGTRNKIEYSFFKQGDQFFTAFHYRDSHYGKVPLPKHCMLASKQMNDLATVILQTINKHDIDRKSLGHLVLRESKHYGQLIAIIYIHDKELTDVFKEIRLDKGSSLVVAYCDAQAGGVQQAQKLAVFGSEVLREKLLAFDFDYSYDAFFQTNPHVFEATLNEIIGVIPENKRVVDLYCGVGTIGLSVATKSASVSAFEINAQAVVWANANAKLNKVSNFDAYELKSELANERVYTDCDILIVDPPRSGLHPKVVANIDQYQPKTLIYLSCNPVTQARDFALLKDKYKIVKAVAYDYYPNTPHVENLLIMQAK